jgi:hypothetical protein
MGWPGLGRDFNNAHPSVSIKSPSDSGGALLLLLGSGFALELLP